MTESRPKHTRVSPSEGPARLDADLGAEITLGLLHEVNNAMTSVFFTLESCLEDMPLAPEVKEDLTRVFADLRSAQLIIGRTSEVCLGARELCYHEAGDLVQRQLDLLGITFPKSTALEFVPSAEALYLQLDEAGFRRIILRLARWVTQRLARPFAVKLSIREATLPGSGQAAVAIAFETTMTSADQSAPDAGAQEYGGIVTARRLDTPNGVETTLLLPRTRLSSEA
jgi:hypothetical protein